MKMDCEEMDSISMLAFLNKFLDAFGNNEIHEIAARWLILYIMKNLAALSLEAWLLQKMIRTARLLNERLSSYVKIVNYLLSTYAIQEIHTDGGAEFRRALTKLWVEGIIISFTSEYIPESKN